MCGVFAVYATDQNVEPWQLLAARKSLAHRGPDEAGTWIHRARRVALAHTRLVIRAAEAGRQPFVDDRGSSIIFNGELYDPPGSPEEHPTHGSMADGAPDGARLLPLLQAHGPDLVHHLRGEFAIIAWDEPRQQLVAARDPYGVKPLFYARHQGALMLASEVKALAAAGLPLEWDEQAVTAMLTTGLLPQGRTLFLGVRELPAGHVLVAHGQKIQLRRWWQPTISSDQPPALETVRAAVEDAVNCRLVSDQPIAVALSGGLDSSVVLALASRRAPVMAISVGFGEADDELTQAQALAEAFGVPFRGLLLDEAELASHYSATVMAVEGPLANAHAVARGRLAAAARAEGRLVLLTGDGGDELFGGYAHLRDERPGLAHPAFVLAGLEAGRGMRRLLRPDVALAWDEADCLSLALEGLALPVGLASRGEIERAMVLWNATVLPRYILPALGDRVESAHGVEGRPVLLDAPLAAVAGRFGEDQRVRDGVDKWALREVARAWLPEEVRCRPKRPLMAPPMGGHEGPLVELLQDTLRGEAGSQLPAVQPLRVRLLLDLMLPIEDPAQARVLDPALHVLLGLALLGQGLGVRYPFSPVETGLNG